MPSAAGERMSQLESSQSAMPASAHREGELAGLRVAGQELVIFESSPPLIKAMVEDIRQAERRVWLESYIFTADAAGRAVAEALKERAAAGVDCRVIYDAVGSTSTPAAFFRDLAAAGVQVHAFHTLWESLWQFRSLRVFNRRDHRKLLVVDDEIAYFGGMNIVDQSGIRSVEEAHARSLPASAGWRDVHVRLSGPRQAEVAAAFKQLWLRVHRRRPPRRARWPVREMLADGGERIDFFDCRPWFKYHQPTRVLAPLIRGARRSITLSMAYFIPDGRMLRELLRAAKRGVKVRVIIPETSDVPAVQWAVRHLYARLLKRGIRLYERRDQMLHSKVMIVDNVWSVIGSCNLDPRSLRINLEFVAVIHSRAMGEAMNRIARYELRNSRRVTPADSLRRRWWQRLLDRMAWSMRRWL
jgi:cardiolipin synthase A/B